MHTLLKEEETSFKKDIELFTKEFVQNNTDLKLLWQELYKKKYIQENNTFLKNILLTEAVCKVSPGIGLFLLTQFACIEIVKNHLSNNKNYLNDLILGKKIGCFSLTEPEAGSDVSMLKTTAKKVDKNWILNGHKIWASCGSIADVFFIFAQTKEHKDKTGISCFLASRSNSLEIFPDTPKLGVKITPSNEIKINNLKLNEDALIGNIGDGIKVALNTITCGRIFCAAQAVGLLSGVLEESIKHSIKRNQFGKSISEYQAIQWYIADMTKDLDAIRLMLYKAAWAKDSNSNELNKLSSMAKYYATSKASKHANIGVQILSGSGLNENSYVANAYRDAKVLEIYEGTNEIQKIIISRELGLN